MDIDLNKLQAAAEAAASGKYYSHDCSVMLNSDIFANVVWDTKLRPIRQSEKDAHFIGEANPTVVLELVRRLKAAEEKLGAMRPLLIGNVNGDATLFGSQEEVKAFHLKMPENEEFARQVAIEEFIAEKVEAFKGLERCSVDEIAEDAGYSDAKYLWLTDVERLLGIPPKQEKPRRPWAEVTGKGKVYKPS